MNEVAPPRFISVSKRPLTTMLATIAEEEKDFNDDEVVKGRRTYSSSVCGKAAICCLSRELESSMLLFLGIAETQGFPNGQKSKAYSKDSDSSHPFGYQCSPCLDL
ncbi:hypothetical protein Goari_017369, partial [Gossypium aridum]|nr:hypothetical protein [Gossypium aridum]